MIIAETTNWIFKCQDRTDLQLKWNVVVFVVRVLSLIVGLKWGIVGVAVSYLISTCILWYPGWAIPFRLIELPFVEMIRNLSGIFGCSASMGVFVYILSLLLPDEWSHFQHLVSLVSFGTSIYLALLCSFKVGAFLELVDLLKEEWVVRVRPFPAKH